LPVIIPDAVFVEATKLACKLGGQEIPRRCRPGQEAEQGGDRPRNYRAIVLARKA
jgi:hypothetical protein